MILASPAIMGGGWAGRFPIPAWRQEVSKQIVGLLGVAVALLAVLTVGCSDDPTAAPTSVPTSTPTPAPTATPDGGASSK